MSDFIQNDQRQAVRSGDAISAVKLSQELTARIDAWAEAHHITRSDAIRGLLEFGLQAAPVLRSPGHSAGRPIDIEENAARQIDQMLDPSLAPEERERRTRRLIEGPPEFARERIDLPKHPK